MWPRRISCEVTQLPKNRIITGLDIGTSQIRALVAEWSDNDQITPIALGVSPARGMKRGVVTDAAWVTDAIQTAMAQASRTLDRRPRKVYVTVSGSHLASLNSTACIPITHSDRKIRETDVNRVLKAARLVVMPQDRQIVHAIPRGFRIDGQSGIVRAVGLTANRLEAQVHVVHALSAQLQNVEQCARHAGLEVMQPIAQSVAAAASVLESIEKESGICLIDIGEGTSDVVVCVEGEVFYSTALPLGGGLVTRDIAYGLSIDPVQAERLKLMCGSAVRRGTRREETLTFTQLGSSDACPLDPDLLIEIIACRVEEIFALVAKELEAAGCAGRFQTGVVLTGGASLLPGCIEAARAQWRLPVRIGRPCVAGRLRAALADPSFATVTGMLLFAAHSSDRTLLSRSGAQALPPPRDRFSVWTRLRGLFHRDA